MSAGARGAGYHPFSDLLACIASVTLAAILYQALFPVAEPYAWSGEWFLGLAITVASCWTAVLFSSSGWNVGFRQSIDRFFSAVGLSLVVLYGIAYLFPIQPAAWPLVVAGSAFSVASVTALRKWWYPALAPRKILLLGFDPVAGALAPPLGSQIVGVVADNPPGASPELPVLGGLSQLRQAVEAQQPNCIVVSGSDWSSHVSPAQLLHLRQSGIAVEDGVALYENLLCRVSWDRLDPMDLLFSTASNGGRAAMAFQAIYTNVIGLGLLLASIPVLIFIAIVVTVLTGGSPVETVECLGFQRIPFQLVRFRTRRRDGELSWIGKTLSRLHLVNLPQLINVVRGEMALFGPPAVRRAFAERLRQVLPIYSQRFAVKPGILGWSQVNLRGRSKPPEETLRMEYDFYYVKQESPSLDLEILARTLAGNRKRQRG
jgi:lipopolysaccharide/colanic/teichoic acid biosynthesis glycosyltransferase